MTAVENSMARASDDVDDDIDGGSSEEVPPRRSGPRLRQAADRRSQEPAVGVVVVTPDQLRALVHEAVRAEVGDRTNESDYLTRDEAATLLKVTPKTLMKYVRDENLPVLRKLGPDWRFSRTQLSVWMGEHSAPSMKAVK